MKPLMKFAIEINMDGTATLTSDGVKKTVPIAKLMMSLKKITGIVPDKKNEVEPFLAEVATYCMTHEKATLNSIVRHFKNKQKKSGKGRR